MKTGSGFITNSSEDEYSSVSHRLLLKWKNNYILRGTQKWHQIFLLRIYTYSYMNVLNNIFSKYWCCLLSIIQIVYVCVPHTPTHEREHTHTQFEEAPVHDLCFSYCSFCHDFYACCSFTLLRGRKKLYIKTDYLLEHSRVSFIFPSSFYEENDRKHKLEPLKKKMHEMEQVGFQEIRKTLQADLQLSGRAGAKICTAYTGPVYLQHLKKDKSGLESEWSWLSKSGF